MDLPAPTLRPTDGLTATFTLLSALELVVLALGVVAVLAGLITLHSSEVAAAAVVVVAAWAGLGVLGLVWLASRIVGTLLVAAHAGNLRALGVTGLRLAPWSWLALWSPLLLRGLAVGALVWLPSYAAWPLVAVALAGLVGCALILHELWRATEPDTLDHWRRAPIGAPVIVWIVLAIVLRPVGELILLRRIASRMRDKRVVVAALGR